MSRSVFGDGITHARGEDGTEAVSVHVSTREGVIGRLVDRGEAVLVAGQTGTFAAAPAAALGSHFAPVDAGQRVVPAVAADHDYPDHPTATGLLTQWEFVLLTPHE